MDTLPYDVVNRIKDFSNDIKTNKENYNNSIPNIIWQTYYDKSIVPQKVYDNMKQFAPNYQHYVYNDNECRQFK